MTDDGRRIVLADLGTACFQRNEMTTDVGTFPNIPPEAQSIKIS